MQVAELQPIGRQQRPGRIPFIIGQEDRAVARDDGDHLLAAARRRKSAGEAAAVLLIDGEGKWHASKLRLVGLGRRMMRVPATQDEGSLSPFQVPRRSGIAVCDAAGIAVSAASIATVRMQTIFVMVGFP